MKICLVRHGETDWNKEGRWQGREDIPMNEKGYAQVSAAGEALKGKGFTVIVTSPLQRARQTAEVIAKKTGIQKIEFYERLIESDLGDASGMNEAERKAAFPDGNYPNMESSESIIQRTYACLLDSVKKYSGENLILTAHGNALWGIMKKIPHPPEINVFVMQNGHYAEIEFDGKEFRITAFNVKPETAKAER